MMKNIYINRVMSSLQRIKSTQSVALHFNEQVGMHGLSMLCSLIDEDPRVQISYIEKAIMDAVLVSRQWGTVKNRIYCIEGLAFVDENTLRSILKYVDIAYVDNRGIEGLMSSRKKRREEVVQQLSNRIFTPELIKILKGWDLYTKVYLSELEDGTPSMQIELLMDGVVALSLTLDGFSGRIAVDGVFCKDTYVAPGQFQQVVLSAIENTINGMTA